MKCTESGTLKTHGTFYAKDLDNKALFMKMILSLVFVLHHSHKKKMKPSCGYIFFQPQFSQDAINITDGKSYLKSYLKYPDCTLSIQEYVVSISAVSALNMMCKQSSATKQIEQV